MWMQRRRLIAGSLVFAAMGMGAPFVGLVPAFPASAAACVETPRPDPSLPLFAAQQAMFGFHDEELVLCSPGAPGGGHPTHLAARLWVPAGCPPVGGCPGVVVVHGFGATKETSVADMRELATRGMYTLAYDVRGQGASGGQADMMGPDTIADEAHVLEWFHRTVAPTRTGVYGISQGGAHALMAAIYNCGPVRAAVFDSTVPCDAGGARWVDAIAPMQAPTRLETIDDGTCSQFMLNAAAESRANADITRDATGCLFDGTPPDAAVDGVGNTLSDGGLGRDNDVRNYQSRVDRIDVPVYLGTSYFDRLVPASNTTSIYESLHGRATDPTDPYYGSDVRMIISNDAHGDIGANFAVLDDVFTWLAYQLGRPVPPPRPAPVASAQEWDANSFRLENGWPIADTAIDARYLDASGETSRLVTTVPYSSTSSIANVPVVTSSPWVPAAKVPVSVQSAGTVPGDSLRYTADPATQLIEITGEPVVDLWLSTPDGGPYGQVTVTLEEVAADGTATQFARVRRGFSDLSGVPTHHRFALSTASWRIEPANRLQVTITPTDIFEATPALANRGLIISHGGATPSHVELPTVDPARAVPAGTPPSGTSFGADPAAAICAGLGLPCPERD